MTCLHRHRPTGFGWGWTAALALLLAVASARADTTWVSGAVSGEWTREGSPYIVVDSTWVAVGEQIQIFAGTKLLFAEGQGIHVFGSISASGNQRDSVAIGVFDNAEMIYGIRFYRQSRSSWSYVAIVCTDTIFSLQPNSEITINNCNIFSFRPISGISRSGVQNCIIRINNSTIHSRANHYQLGGRVYSNNTSFDFSLIENNDPAFFTRGTFFQLTKCTIIGKLTTEWGVVFADSCRFLQTPNGRSSGVTVGAGRLSDSIVQGQASVGLLDNPNIALVINSDISGSMHIQGNAQVLGTNIGGVIWINFSDSVVLRKSIINNYLFCSSQNRTLIIDSCYFLNKYPVKTFSIGELERLTVRRCIFLNFAINNDPDNVLYDHNTFVYDSLDCNIRVNRNTAFENNIFITSRGDQRIFHMMELPTFRYNSVWGFEIAAGYRDTISIEELDSTNIVSNPQLAWIDNTPYLSRNSPCIDRGDPNFDYDPDGTRSDIGARAYYQRNNVVNPMRRNLISVDDNLSIFPNPFNNTLTISSTYQSPNSISLNLIDISGKRILGLSKSEFSELNKRFQINTSHLPAGRYFLQYESGKTTKVIPINCVK